MVKAAYLFQKIDDKKEEEWRTKYGGTQASRLAEEEAKAKKKADKEREKERKKAKKESAAAGGTSGKTVVEGKADGTIERKDKAAKVDAVQENEIPFRGMVAEEQAPPPAAAS